MHERGEGPTLIETITYRLTAHSSDDDDRQYRAAKMLQKGRQRIQLLLFEPI